jgi:hypothetical protein
MCRRIIALLLLAACRSQPAAQTMTSRNLGAVEPSSGHVSAKLLPAPDSPAVQLGPGEEFTPPQLHRFNRGPAYPAALVDMRLGPHTIVMRVTFDEEGRAMKIEPSPLAPSTESEQRSAFETAVREALQQWRCDPPRIRKFRPGPDSEGDGKVDYRVLTSERRFKTFFDVSFSFEVVNGQPVVRSLP